MDAQAIDIDYLAEIPFSRLTMAEQADVEHLLVHDMSDPRDRRVARSGNYISLLGDTRRVIWRLSDRGRPLVLGVVELP